MNIKHLIVLLVSSLMLSACVNKITSDCSSETAYKLIGQTIAEAVEKKTSNEKYINTGEFIFDKAKIRALLEKLQITVESVRTAQEDPNSSKKFCSGILKVTIPTSMLADADQAKELENKPKISQTARTLDIENNINIFTKKDFAYSVQPTDDGKELYVESENTIWVEMLHDITRSALLKPILEVQKAEQARQNEQEKQEVENLKRETEIFKLEAEKLSALHEKQEADRLKQELLDKQVAETAEQNSTTSLDDSNAQQGTDNSPRDKLSNIHPSFDCKKATKPTESAICNNSELASLDVENMKFYKQAKGHDATTTKNILSKSIKNKYACGTNVQCISESYKRSIAAFHCISEGTQPNCSL